MGVAIVKKLMEADNVVYPYWETSGMKDWLHPELVCFGLAETEAEGLLHHFIELVTRKGKNLNSIDVVHWQNEDVYCLWVSMAFKYYFFPVTMREEMATCFKQKYDYNLRLG